MDMIEKVARAISGHIGPEFDAAYAHKGEWTADRGSRADINAPFKSDYLEAARAAIEALMEPTEGMLEAALDESGNRVTAYAPATEGGVPIECGMSDADAAEINSLMKAAFAADFRAAIEAALEEGK